MRIMIVKDRGWFRYRGQVYLEDKLVYEVQAHTVSSILDDVKQYLRVNNEFTRSFIKFMS